MTCNAAAGIDAGKLFLDVAFAPRETTFRVNNTPDGIKTIIARLRRASIATVVIEAIGVYAAPLVRALTSAGCTVGIVNPRRIKAFRDAEGKRAKNDRLDAALIARFAVTMTDAVRPLPSDHQMTIKALATRRRQVVEMGAMEKTRLKQAPDERIADSHRKIIAALQAERQAIEDKLDALIARSPELTRRCQIFNSIPGIGKQVATVLATDMPELGNLDRRGAASLAGLAPHIQQSGTAKGRAQISGGRPCVRAALYMAALSAARYNPEHKAAYTQMRGNGKPAKIALIAIARRIIILANALVKTDQLFEKQHPRP